MQLLAFPSWVIVMGGLNGPTISPLWVGIDGPTKSSECGAGPVRLGIPAFSPAKRIREWWDAMALPVVFLP